MMSDILPDQPGAGSTATERTAARPFQFTLAHLMAAPVVVALFCASVAWLGCPGVVLFVFLACLAYTLLVPVPEDAPVPFRRRYLLVLPAWVGLAFLWGMVAPAGVSILVFVSLATAMVLIIMCFSLRSPHWACAGIGLVTLIFLLFLPAMGTTRSVVRRVQCTNNLKQIGLALHNYHDVHQCLPPAYVTDEEGKPLYSWRVLILPYLEHRPLYEQFNLDEPWDSPGNITLSQTQLECFLCPSDGNNWTRAVGGLTNYLAIVGPDTPWPGQESTCLADFTDSTANTLLVVEVLGSGISWAEPRELHVDQMTPAVNPRVGQGISSAHEDGANTAVADGTVRFLPDSLTPEEIQARLTINGGDDSH